MIYEETRQVTLIVSLIKDNLFLLFTWTYGLARICIFQVKIYRMVNVLYVSKKF